MRCMSCGADIPPQWVGAIRRNECPGCEGEIMGESTQTLLKELTEAMGKMPNDPQGVAGWLISNYRFQKMGSAEPVEKFHRKGGGGSFDESNLKIDPTYNEFIKRNEAGKLVARGEQLAKLKNSGNGKLAEMASMIQDVGDVYGDDTTTSEGEEMPDVEDQKALVELSSAGMNPFASNPGGGITDLSQAIDPREVANLMNQNEDTQLREELLLSQTQEGRNYLQRDRFKKLKAQDAVSGGGSGVFRR